MKPSGKPEGKGFKGADSEKVRRRTGQEKEKTGKET
jgi:hypothetical protein